MRLSGPAQLHFNLVKLVMCSWRWHRIFVYPVHSAGWSASTAVGKPGAGETEPADIRIHVISPYPRTTGWQTQSATPTAPPTSPHMAAACVVQPPPCPVPPLSLPAHLPLGAPGCSRFRALSPRAWAEVTRFHLLSDDDDDDGDGDAADGVRDSGGAQGGSSPRVRRTRAVTWNLVKDPPTRRSGGRQRMKRCARSHANASDDQVTTAQATPPPPMGESESRQRQADEEQLMADPYWREAALMEAAIRKARTAEAVSVPSPIGSNTKPASP
jgi:hypothetical protein